jgi:NitT/TauT family transport system substrate-binding protein
MKSFSRLMFILLLSLVLVGCRADKQALEKVVLPVGFIPSVQFAPFYAAVHNGYFAEYGYDVELLYGYEIDAVSLVGSGEYKVAIASGEQVVLAQNQGLPVVYVYNWFEDYPVGITALKTSGIRQLSDLTGKVIGIPALQGASYIAYKGFESIGEFDPESIRLDVIGFTQAELLSQRKVDAAVVYLTNEPVVLTEQGYELVTFALSDFLLLVGNGIVTNDLLVENDPEFLQNFIEATNRGVDFVANNPEEAYELCKQYVPNLENDQTFQYQVLVASIDIWNIEQKGRSDADAWENTLTLMSAIGLAGDHLSVEDLFTNELIDD